MSVDESLQGVQFTMDANQVMLIGWLPKKFVRVIVEVWEVVLVSELLSYDGEQRAMVEICDCVILRARIQRETVKWY